jgi:diaminopimelate epimerase
MKKYTAGTRDVQGEPGADRPGLGASFYKAHGLGNDYLVFEEGDAWRASAEAVQRVCSPHVGVGSDGVVALLGDRSGRVLRARMFNPDGSEFERSGNGLRVLGAWLARSNAPAPYRVRVGGDEVLIHRHGSGDTPFDLSVEMGHARIGADAVALDPTALAADGTLAGPGGEALAVVPVSVGNPHLVVRIEELTSRILERIGPFLVGHPSLAEGANVQLARPTGEARCEILIWERGVGPTMATGTSACAVAAAMVSVGALDPGTITVSAPGGDMVVTVGADLDLVLRGPIEEICTGSLAPGFMTALAAL